MACRGRLASLRHGTRDTTIPMRPPTMRAAVLHRLGGPLAIETVPDPVLGTGEVIVDVMASRVLAYANEVLSGERKYLLDLPVVPGPGAIGRVRATGPDATRLRPGDWVYCDPTVRSRDNALSPDITLQGLSAGGEGGKGVRAPTAFPERGGRASLVTQGLALLPQAGECIGRQGVSQAEHQLVAQFLFDGFPLVVTRRIAHVGTPQHASSIADVPAFECEECVGIQ